MLSDQELYELIKDLRSDDTPTRVAALQDLIQYPAADIRVLSHLEDLLENTTPCLVMIPYRFGEIRFLAAQALAAEREALGIDEPMRLSNVVRPLDTEELVSIEKAAGIQSRGGIEGMLKNFEILREMGRLPLYDLEL